MVCDMRYSFVDIDKSNVMALDKYIKTIIINTKSHFTVREEKILHNELFLEDLDVVFQTSCHEKYDGKYSYIYHNDVCKSIEDIELFNVLMQLSELERDIIFYNVFEGYKINEIARKKGVSDKTIRKYKNLALKKLKMYLG